MARKRKKRPVNPQSAPSQQPRGEVRSPPVIPESATQTAAETTAPHPELELVLEEDGLKAVVRTIYPQTSTEEILELLRGHDVSSSSFKPAIRRAVEIARETGQVLRDVVVAEGQPPKPSPPPRIEYYLPDGLDSPPPLEPIRQLLTLQDRDEIARTAASLQAWEVKPGDRLAIMIFPEGKAGINVRGQPIPPLFKIVEGGIIDRLQPGPGGELAANGFDFLACIYGYAGLENSQVSVFAPLWIAADDMEACFLNLPRIPGSRAPSPDDLHALLEFSGVTTGIDEEALGSLCQAPANGRSQDTLITLARGRPAVAPKDATPSFSFRYDTRVGTIRSDGSIDFKERNLFPSVQQDALLLECQPSAPGEPGQTVRGEEISVAAPVGAELIAGENVRLEEEDGVQRLYATIEGGVSVKTVEICAPTGVAQAIQYDVAVQQVAQIAGDVGYETGNIEFQGNVLISGSVNAGFCVGATGDIAIVGSVEAGSQVKAGGDVTVQQGIVGLEIPSDQSTRTFVINTQQEE